MPLIPFKLAWLIGLWLAPGAQMSTIGLEFSSTQNTQN
jgi:hypothetical protein